ncbi:hypothetical protein BV898_07269 [Hypsibius exemplaris]|uniref:CUB domain-containing protein n=1 Tax=Hypsibius exemplaris TaxID=2072580 RepID=A0A1W0WTX3_HYPEX|nr:hypothetical protein BV898_07269 [Hypsibius exemplaris]
MAKFTGIRQALSAAVMVTLCVSWTGATTIDFKNLCAYPINLVKTRFLESPVSECQLTASGGSCSKSYDDGLMIFQSGRDSANATMVAFNLDVMGQDYYMVAVEDGYNVPLKLTTSTGGFNITCTEPKCPEGYLFPNDDAKIHATATGGTFTLTFCPVGDGAPVAISRVRIAKQKMALRRIQAAANQQSQEARKTVPQGLHRFRLALDFDLE